MLLFNIPPSPSRHHHASELPTFRIAAPFSLPPSGDGSLKAIRDGATAAAAAAAAGRQGMVCQAMIDFTIHLGGRKVYSVPSLYLESRC